MFGTREEDSFATTATTAAMRNKGAWRLLSLIVLAICAFVLWAANFEIEEVTRGVGRVVPSSDTQIVQSLEGGLVRSVAVSEGDEVQKGDLLLVIDDAAVVSQERELLEREGALLAEQFRLNAEASGATSLEFPEDLGESASKASLAEQAVFLSRQTQLRGELQILADQKSQREAELAELQAQETKLSAVIAPLTEEAALTEDLAARGAVPQIELLRLRSRVAEMAGDLAVVRARIPRMEAAVSEAEAQMQAALSAFQLSASERLARLQVELAVVRETLGAVQGRVAQTELRAPARGIVNQLISSSPGVVVAPGATVAAVVPLDDGLLIEAQINPQDVAFVQEGERVSVKITAYDYLIYGTLQGEVLRVGADSIESADGEPIFRVIVRTDRTYLGDPDQPNPIIPGMIASIDIQTGTNSVLNYLAKPLLRARSEAFRER